MKRRIPWLLLLLASTTPLLTAHEAQATADEEDNDDEEEPPPVRVTIDPNKLNQALLELLVAASDDEENETVAEDLSQENVTNTVEETSSSVNETASDGPNATTADAPDSSYGAKEPDVSSEDLESEGESTEGTDASTTTAQPVVFDDGDDLVMDLDKDDEQESREDVEAAAEEAFSTLDGELNRQSTSRDDQASEEDLDESPSVPDDGSVPTVEAPVMDVAADELSTSETPTTTTEELSVEDMIDERTEESTEELPRAKSLGDVEDEQSRESDVLKDCDLQPTCGVWGRPEHRQADLTILYRLFDGIVNPVEKEHGPNAAVVATSITDSAFQRAAADSELESEEAEVDEAKKKVATANEIVDGLDDLDKFFEGVEAPDELDVAGGSSIQEVLMGSGTRIVLKRINMGWTAVRKAATRAKNKLMDVLHDDDGNFSIKKEHLVKMSQKVWHASLSAFHHVQHVVDRLFEKVNSIIVPTEDEEEEFDFDMSKIKGDGA